ncbi:methyltransferase type 11 [Alkalihalobacillus alcalophilus ATCC 27647 = CGMCC 1.3604]|uniref:Methyltransferase type 11 n=1 Tax=Alkalihalobacillus alcalophilus ATCC 27647 = CGMCC 1.3604 TaxID=1218173 RepID=A0A094WHW4_ALKAL|nr:class I SAM-dependent methyltransferase [Alkalihalobacillus alcalophilus]KGA96401.1 methyltransferase type 11 [Alkalihalobacillus alcalophilus ATCC 27647 = CGMCC 1.3604]MED1563226.1 class I SAM-dependent methyltransferase [Alkalihalobacillus alcalophilus]
MGMDFHDQKNRSSYMTRKANQNWLKMVQKLVPITKIERAIDIGCGGGIYTKALLEMGVQSVIGIDFSEVMIEAAKENLKNYHNVTFQKGTAYDSQIKADSVDLLLERALIHHLDDLNACFSESYRILQSKGYYLIQDRTIDDCLLPGSEEHIRGYFFELFPHLIEKESARRYTSEQVVSALKHANFAEISEVQLWEVRKEYKAKDELLNDIRERTGRSILHDLTDAQLQELVSHLDEVLPSGEAIVEKDRWTIWKAQKE